MSPTAHPLLGHHRCVVAQGATHRTPPHTHTHTSRCRNATSCQVGGEGTFSNGEGPGEWLQVRGQQQKIPAESLVWVG